MARGVLSGGPRHHAHAPVLRRALRHGGDQRHLPPHADGHGVAGWSTATPSGFVFSLKAPRRITHVARLAGVEEPVHAFAETARGLGPKLGPLLFQLPPSFRKDTSRLAGALAALPGDLRVAFEFRHASWFSDDVYSLLRARDAALCIVDAEDGTTPDVVTATWGYVRLRDRTYAEGELAAWAAALGRRRWREAFVYFKHEESGLGPALAAQLVARLTPAAAAVPGGRRPLARAATRRPGATASPRAATCPRAARGTSGGAAGGRRSIR